MLNYRLAATADLDPVYDLYMDKASNPYLTYDPMEKNEFIPIFENLLATNTLFVVEDDDKVIASYRLIPKENRQAHTLYLGSFVIKNDLKGKGLGTRVLTQIKEYSISKGYKRLELTVDLKNEAAIKLYKKIGFETEGVIRRSYRLSSTNEYYDEYLMGILL